MIQRLLLTSIFINENLNLTPQLSLFLVEMTLLEFVIAALHQYSCVCINVRTIILNISLNILLSSARLISNCPVHIQKQAEHVSLSPAVVITCHCISSYLYYKATMMPIAIHSQQVPLICTLTQQGSLAVAQVDMSFMLSLLMYTFQL